MAAVNTPAHDEPLALVAKTLCTRPLALFAQGSRADGESLKDAVERYEVDYAWQVLASDRLRDETVALLEAKLKHPATDAQKACVADVLRAAGFGAEVWATCVQERQMPHAATLRPPSRGSIDSCRKPYRVSDFSKTAEDRVSVVCDGPTRRCQKARCHWRSKHLTRYNPQLPKA